MNSVQRPKSQSQNMNAARQPTWDKLYQRGLVTAAKQQLVHEEAAEMSNGELDACTFHPNINHTSRTIAVKNFSNSEDLFVKLFEDAAELRRRREEKAAERRKREQAQAASERKKLKELANRHSGVGVDVAPQGDESPVFDRLSRLRKAKVERRETTCTFQPDTTKLRSASQQKKIDALCQAARKRQQAEEESSREKELRLLQQQQQQQQKRANAAHRRTASRDSGGARGSSVRSERSGEQTPRHAKATESFTHMRRAQHADPHELVLPADEPLTLRQLHEHNLHNAARVDLPQPTRPDWFLP